MGIRHLIVVQNNKNIKVAQYSYLDGFPKDTGLKIVDFLSLKANRTRLRNALKKTSFYSELNSIIVHNDEYYEMFNAKDIGYRILKTIAYTKHDEIRLTNCYNFGYNSMACGFVYVINYDTNDLEIYKGPNRTKLAESERFYTKNHTDDGYKEFYGCKLLVKFDLSSINKKTYMKWLRGEGYE